MPQFNFSRRTPQGQVDAPRIRDHGQGIREQGNQSLMQGLQSLNTSFQEIEYKHTADEADSDMSSFQAERIRREQAFRESSAEITNDVKYKKHADEYIKNLNKYAAGKLEDGTEVFRNGMGKAGYKEFSKIYSAQFKAKADDHAFGLKRKRNKLNYRKAINSGIQNVSGDIDQSKEAIIQTYASMVDGGHLSQEEASIEQERDIKLMTINHFKETQATMMLGTEEILNRIGQEQIVFDGTGAKRPQDTVEKASEVITGAFENYKAEVYLNKNLNDQERKGLIDNAKDSLRYLQTMKKTEFAAKKEAVEVERAGLHGNYLRDVAKDPAAIAQIGKQYLAEHPNLEEKTLQKITTQSVDAHERFIKSESDFTQKLFNRMADLSLRSSIMSSTLATGKDYDNAINELSKISDPILRSATYKWIEDHKPGSTPKDPVLDNSIKAFSEDLKMSFGLDLTRTQAAKLNKHQKYGHADTYWDPKVPEGFPDPKKSRQEYIQGMTRGQRLEKQYELVENYTEIYNKKGKEAADEYKDKALEGINKDYNTKGFLNIFLKPSFIKPR